MTRIRKKKVRKRINTVLYLRGDKILKNKERQIKSKNAIKTARP